MIELVGSNFDFRTLTFICKLHYTVLSSAILKLQIFSTHYNIYKNNRIFKISNEMQNTGSVNMSLVIWILSGVFSMVSRKYFYTNININIDILILILILILMLLILLILILIGRSLLLR